MAWTEQKEGVGHVTRVINESKTSRDPYRTMINPVRWRI